MRPILGVSDFQTAAPWITAILVERFQGYVGQALEVRAINKRAMSKINSLQNLPPSTAFCSQSKRNNESFL